MTDYLNPSKIPYANSCVSCGAEMGEGDMVCPACISTTQESLQVQYELPEWYKKKLEAEEEKVRKSAEIICEGADRVRNLMGLKIWLIEQIEKETDITRLQTLKRMLEGMKE